MDLEYFSKK